MTDLRTNILKTDKMYIFDDVFGWVVHCSVKLDASGRSKNDTNAVFHEVPHWATKSAGKDGNKSSASGSETCTSRE